MHRIRLHKRIVSENEPDMHNRGAVFQNIIEANVRLRQKNLDEHKESFLFACAKILLHKLLRIEKNVKPAHQSFLPYSGHKSPYKGCRSIESTKKKLKKDIVSKLQVKIEDAILKEERVPQTIEQAKDIINDSERKNSTANKIMQENK